MVDQQGVRTNLFYKDILEVSYQEAPDYGEPCGGTEQDAMRLGQWQSEAFGRYENCTYLNVADCILLKTAPKHMQSTLNLTRVHMHCLRRFRRKWQNNSKRRGR